MPGHDLNHWLHRLTADEWLAAAATEIAHCQQTLVRRAFRPAVTHARRAAGMAINAVLSLQQDEAYGRSYMDHVVALARDEGAPPEVRASAQNLRDTPPLPPELVTLGKPDLRVFEDVQRIMSYARQRVASLSGTPS